MYKIDKILAHNLNILNDVFAFIKLIFLLQKVGLCGIISMKNRAARRLEEKKMIWGIVVGILGILALYGFSMWIYFDIKKKLAQYKWMAEVITICENLELKCAVFGH